ncbi:MAG: hypothetical protein QM753_20460 [Thermomicrobiales bacterium]
MGWETRPGGGRYYTRSRRVNGRVVREYVGCGKKGELAALADAERRAKRDAERALIREELERADVIDAELAMLHQMVDTLNRGMLLAAGFERYKRQWRTRHDDLSEPASQAC